MLKAEYINKMIKWVKTQLKKPLYLIIFLGIICVSVFFKVDIFLVISIVGLIFFVLFLLYFFVSNVGMREKRAIELKQEYEDILDRLSRNPNSQRLRQLALQIARDYYSSLRNDGRLTIYDEQAIQNDLSVVINSSNNSYTQQSNDNSDSLAKLEKLKQLKDKGLITEADYEAKKQKILDEI